MISKKEIEFSKETDEVLVFLIELVKDIKAKKSMAEIAAENLPNLMTAMSGMDQLDDEAKNRRVLSQTIAIRLAELGEALF